MPAARSSRMILRSAVSSPFQVDEPRSTTVRGSAPKPRSARRRARSSADIGASLATSNLILPVTVESKPSTRKRRASSSLPAAICRKCPRT